MAKKANLDLCKLLDGLFGAWELELPDHCAAPAQQHIRILAWLLLAALSDDGPCHGLHEGLVPHCLLQKLEHCPLGIHGLVEGEGLENEAHQLSSIAGHKVCRVNDSAQESQEFALLDYRDHDH